MERKINGKPINPTRQLETIREQITSLTSELAAALATPIASEETIQEIERDLATVMSIVVSERPITRCSEKQLLVASHYKQLRENLTAFVRDNAPQGMSESERNEAVASLRDSILGLESDEEMLTVRMESAGHDVVRRGDLNPAVFLACTDEGAHPNLEKLQSLFQNRHRLMLRLREMNLDVAGCRSSIKELRAKNNAWNAAGDDSSDIRAQLDKEVKKLAELEALHADVSNRSEAVRQLAGACEEFCKARGIQVPDENVGMPTAVFVR